MKERFVRVNWVCVSNQDRVMLNKGQEDMIVCCVSGDQSLFHLSKHTHAHKVHIA